MNKILIIDDDKKLTELLEQFFKFHDPTSLDQQGNDIGPQYRAIVFYGSDKQKDDYKKFFDNAINALDECIVDANNDPQKDPNNCLFENVSANLINPIMHATKNINIERDNDKELNQIPKFTHIKDSVNDIYQNTFKTIINIDSIPSYQ